MHYQEKLAFALRPATSVMMITMHIMLRTLVMSTMKPLGMLHVPTEKKISPSLIEMGGLDELSAYVIMPEGLMAPQPIHGISGVAELSYWMTLHQKNFNFRSPGTDYYVSNSGVCAINETGTLWPWAVTYSYGRFKLSGSYSYRLCVLGALEW